MEKNENYEMLNLNKFLSEDSFHNKKRNSIRIALKVEEAEEHAEDDVEYEDASPPFKIGKRGLDGIMQKYLNRSFTEDVDFLNQKGGITWVESILLTNKELGLNDSDELRIQRITAFDTNQSLPDAELSKY